MKNAIVNNQNLKGVFAKNEREYKLNALLIAANLTSIRSVYKVKIVKDVDIPNNLASIQIEKIATYDLDRKNQFNFKQIIQILQPMSSIIFRHICK